MERIKCAAYLYNDAIYEGKNHGEIASKGPKKEATFANGNKAVMNLHYWGKDGFVTTKGRFVDRKEAAKIAISSGQIKRLRFLPCGELDSSDLNEPDNEEPAHYKTPDYLLDLIRE